MKRSTWTCALAGVLLATAALPAAAATNLNQWFSAATPSQQSHTPTVTGNPACLGTFRKVNNALIVYQVFCSQITGITAVQLQEGTADANSNSTILHTMLTLPAGSGPVEGLLLQGAIRREQFGNAAFNALADKIRNDNVFMNVLTLGNTGGEVRGQLSGIVGPGARVLPY